MRGVSPKSAFTMVELLAVMAMIAVIATLLFPVLNKGKRNAQVAYDLNNIRQITMAAQFYAGDNDDFLPQPGWGTSVQCWAAGAKIPPGHTRNFENYTNVFVRQVESFHKGQLSAWLTDVRLLHCPADNVLNQRFLERNIYISSYVWNAAIIGYPDEFNPVPFPVTFKLRQFQPDAIMQWEADEMRPFAAYPDEGISARHNSGSTIGRFDGGAERISVAEFINHSGSIAGSLSGSGIGWKHSHVRAPNRAWCNPLHHGIPDTSNDDPFP